MIKKLFRKQLSKGLSLYLTIKLAIGNYKTDNTYIKIHTANQNSFYNFFNIIRSWEIVVGCRL